jgi:hypothetical protein
LKFDLIGNIPYEEIENGALILVLLRTSKTWDALCSRYAYADPANMQNTNTMMLRNKLFAMRELGLLTFEEKDMNGEKIPDGDIKETNLWSSIRVAFGGLSLSEVALLSRHSKGMAVAPVFGRPREQDNIDIFVLMPFKAKLEKVYTEHIKKMCAKLGLTIRRADEVLTPGPFMEKVWDGICAAKLILADCTEKNPNVFYEIGMAHTVGKKVMLITRSEKDIPSDIKHFDYIPYIYDPEGVDALVNKLSNFLENHFSHQAPVKSVSR